MSKKEFLDLYTTKLFKKLIDCGFAVDLACMFDFSYSKFGYVAVRLRLDRTEGMHVVEGLARIVCAGVNFETILRYHKGEEAQFAYFEIRRKPGAVENISTEHFFRFGHEIVQSMKK